MGFIQLFFFTLFFFLCYKVYKYFNVDMGTMMIPDV